MTRADDTWEAGRGYRSRPLTVAAGQEGFMALGGSATGVRFTNELADASVALNRILENGSGVALGDVDDDGRCDVYLCRIEGANALYRNLGNWRFEDITAAAGVACAGQHSTGAVLEDVDGDGDLDLLVNGIGAGTRSFRNDGRGRFEEITETRLVRRFGSTSMALADVEGDGDLDLYVGNYRTDTFKDHPPGLQVSARRVDGRIVVIPEDRFVPLKPRDGGMEVLERGERDFLYLNDGRGGFAPISWTRGGFLDEDGRPLTEPYTDWELSVMFRDLNGDAWPDLYTCSDFVHWKDRVWLSDPGKGFRALPREAQRCQSVSSMSIDFADINRDGFVDFFVTDMVSRRHAFRQRQRPNMLRGLMDMPVEDPLFRPEVPHNTLFVNRGDGTFAEIAQFSGVQWSEWSWSGVFLDVDLDGFEDLLITTGNAHDVQDADVLNRLNNVREDRPRENNLMYLRWFPALETPCLAFRNRGDLTFEERGAAWGFNRVGVSQGMALGDLDNDGDQDVVINNLNAEASLLQNRTGAPRVAVRLRGAGANRRGIGARIEVRGGPVYQWQEMVSGGRYVSSDDALRVFAGGSPTNRVDIRVVWRGGKVSEVRGLPVNRLYELDEAVAGPAEPPPAAPSPWFEDVSSRLDHRQVENTFDDFKRQPLLPRRLSRLGPGLAWVDVNGDGLDDLLVGAAKGSTLAWFQNNGQGTFKRLEGGWLAEAAGLDQATILGFRKAPGPATLLVASSTWEDPAASGEAVVARDPVGGGRTPVLPATATSVGPMAMADVDGDGDLDLFVGGRAVAGRYPEPADSKMLLQQDGGWIADPRTASLARLGLVSGALFSDLDGDGSPELVVACEWGAIRIFQFAPEGLMEETEAWGLSGLTGWWTGVAAGDFDGDGRMDLVAGNWGRNNDRAAYAREGLRLVYGDFNGDGTVDMVEAFHDPDSGKVVPWRDWLAVTHALPFITERFPTYRAFGEASVAELFGDRFAQAKEWEARTLEHGVFLNRGKRFEFRALPAEAQWAPAFGLGVADFDGDGCEDVVLAQNFFGVEIDSPRQAAGRGLWLRGDGHGGFKPVPGQESGIKVYGEQRGAAVADFDGDGRVDLALGQNSESTRLYRNVRGRAGWRVRLEGPIGNPEGIGAVVSLEASGRTGAAREVHAGGGYWSQDSAVQVLGSDAEPTAVRVRWPGGKEQQYPWPTGKREVTVRVGVSP